MLVDPFEVNKPGLNDDGSITRDISGDSPRRDTGARVQNPDGSQAAIKDNTDDTFKYDSYSGTDIAAVMVLPGEPPISIGELQTISYSIHRENTPVRLLGHVNPVSFVKGPRTIAGSLIFTVFNEYFFYNVRKFRDAMHNGFYPLGDMMPPFDVSLSFSNEYGMFSKMKIFGISLIDEGGTMSVDDLITESTMSYMARGIQPITSYNPTAMKHQPLAARSSKGEPIFDGMKFN